MKIEVYTRSQPPCSYCMATKATLQAKRLDFIEYEVGKDLSKEQLIEKFPMARTMPVVLVDDTYIGGYNELEDHLLSRALGGMAI